MVLFNWLLRKRHCFTIVAHLKETSANVLQFFRGFSIVYPFPCLKLRCLSVARMFNVGLVSEGCFYLIVAGCSKCCIYFHDVSSC